MITEVFYLRAVLRNVLEQRLINIYLVTLIINLRNNYLRILVTRVEQDIEKFFQNNSGLY